MKLPEGTTVTVYVLDEHGGLPVTSDPDDRVLEVDSPAILHQRGGTSGDWSSRMAGVSFTLWRSTGPGEDDIEEFGELAGAEVDTSMLPRGFHARGWARLSPDYTDPEYGLFRMEEWVVSYP